MITEQSVCMNISYIRSVFIRQKYRKYAGIGAAFVYGGEKICYNEEKLICTSVQRRKGYEENIAYGRSSHGMHGAWFCDRRH